MKDIAGDLHLPPVERIDQGFVPDGSLAVVLVHLCEQRIGVKTGRFEALAHRGRLRGRRVVLAAVAFGIAGPNQLIKGLALLVGQTSEGTIAPRIIAPRIIARRSYLPRMAKPILP